MADLEDIHEALARAIDTAGPERTPVVLAAIALSLAQALGDPDRALALIADAAQPLPERR